MALETCDNLKQYVVSKDNFTDDLHYVKIPENNIVIDFDIKDRDSNKRILIYI